MSEFQDRLQRGELYTSEEDKKKLGLMPEIQRESILLERYEKIKNMENRKLLKNVDCSDSEESESAENEEINNKKKKQKIKEIKEIKEKPDYKDCDFVLNRDFVMKNVFKPFFNIVKGGFVKFNLNHKYFIAKIMNITKVPVYEVKAETVYKCSVGFDLDLGFRTITGTPIIFLSGTAPTAEEFNDFLENFKVESLDSIRSKHAKIISEFNRSLTDAEVTQMIENRLKDNPRKITNTERKIQLKCDQFNAITNRDKELAKKIQAEIEAIENEEMEERRKQRIKEYEDAVKRCKKRSQEENAKRSRLF